MRKRECWAKFWLVLGVLVMGGFLVGPPAASALTGACGTTGNPACSGPTITDDVCMQTLFSGGAAVTNSNRVNCTANDIRISNVIAIFPTSCTLDSTFDLTGTFEITTTANTRYDAGFFFNIAGGTSARDGTCSLSVLTPAVGDALELDGDTCGDLNAGTTQVTFTIPGVLCADTDGDGLLNLPNCTSWHNKAGTVCTATDTPPNAAPDTKSKCVCDDTFQVGVIVQKPEGNLVKKATKALVTYEVTVSNTGDRDATIEGYTDVLYGDINQGAFVDPVKSSTCVNGTAIAKTTGVVTCEFTVEIVNPGTAGDQLNTVNATLKASSGNPDETAVTGSTTINVNLNVGGP